ncbi:MAG: prolipoprotein diacylglyceryl transferase [Polyangiaceae bacterium]|nr:prolipoprotein diacylglyceryl transferase [Polyangiaceae bacterium]
MALDPLIPYIPTERLVLTLVPEGALGGGFPPIPIAIQPFGVLVAVGVYLGAYLAVRQARRVGLDEKRMGSFITWVVGLGFIIGHVLEVLFYRPRELVEDPLVVLRVWDGLSSFAGFIGGVVGAFVWRARSGQRVLPYADVLASALPVGWVFGRMGCSVAHDHPGLESDAWFAVQFPNGGRYDLGLYEMVLTIPLAVAFLLLRRRRRPWGFFIATMALYYAPVRFALDFLRVGDARYFALTPAQWLSIVLVVVGVGFLWHLMHRSSPDEDDSLVLAAAGPVRGLGAPPRGSPSQRRAARRAARAARS